MDEPQEHPTNTGATLPKTANEEQVREIAEHRSRMAAILEATTDFVATTDVNGRLLYINRAGRAMLGIGLDEDLSQMNIAACHPEWARTVILNEGLPSAIHYGAWSGETALLNRDGKEIPISQVILAHKASDGTVEYLSTIARDISERKAQTAVLEYQATHDALTNLPNRNLLHDRLQQAILAAHRDGKPLTLLILDLDRFKEINDALGHHHGDLLLNQVGERLRGALRESDTVARLGGDEFALLLPNVDREGAILVVHKMLESFENTFSLEELTLDLGASIGIALFPEHGRDADTLMRRADVAMYVAKQGGNGYAVYATEYDQHTPYRLALMSELRTAIEHEDLVLHYQPKLSLKTHRIVGVEALVRWQHPHHGLIPPDHFIPLSERTGLVKPLTLWVLQKALRQCKVWHQTGIPINVAINLSARNLQDSQLPEQVAQYLQEWGIVPSWLEFELTESIIMADPIRSMETLSHLHQMGIRLTIDDFGTGYSSLVNLKKLPVDAIKIAKAFIINMMKDEDDSIIVHSTIDLAYNLGLKVIAEGVENQETWNRLKVLGCDAVQGYYLCHPVPPEELISWLSQSSWAVGQEE